MQGWRGSSTPRTRWSVVLVRAEPPRDSSRRKPFEAPGLFQCGVPRRSTRDENVSGWLDANFAIQAARRHDEQISTHLCLRERRAGVFAAVLAVAEIEALEFA